MSRKLEDIWDGRFYDAKDMARAGCGGCVGCSDCCRDMGDTIVLDPFDMYRLTKGTGLSAMELLQSKLDLGVVQGVILPHLRMVPTTEGRTACAFLSEEGRCTVHESRPGICRLFPLGRYYEEEGMRYILQAKECPKPNKIKVRVRDWADTENLEEYEKFVFAWHNYLLDYQVKAMNAGDEEAREISMGILKRFYLTEYNRLDEIMLFITKPNDLG